MRQNEKWMWKKCFRRRSFSFTHWRRSDRSAQAFYVSIYKQKKISFLLLDYLYREALKHSLSSIENARWEWVTCPQRMIRSRNRCRKVGDMSCFKTANGSHSSWPCQYFFWSFGKNTEFDMRSYEFRVGLKTIWEANRFALGDFFALTNVHPPTHLWCKPCKKSTMMPHVLIVLFSFLTLLAKPVNRVNDIYPRN